MFTQALRWFCCCRYIVLRASHCLRGFVLWLSLFWYALLCDLSIFAIILTKKRWLVALLLLSFECFVTVNVLRLFLMVPWVCLQSLNVVFPNYTHLLFVSLVKHGRHIGIMTPTSSSSSSSALSNFCFPIDIS